MFAIICQMFYCLSMKLKEIRKSHKITQKQASMIIGIPYRTYVRYEEDDSYLDTYKYKKMVEDLSNALRIDESTGILTFNQIKELLIPLLEKFNITYCYLFGSYARNDAKETSDVDLLMDTNITGIKFFELVEQIRNTLHKKIDLLRLCDLTPNNPIVIEILKEGVRIL